MDYKKLSVDSWRELDSSGTITTGYKTAWIGTEDELSTLHIFKDEHDKFHFVIEDEEAHLSQIQDPMVNGLSVMVSQYRISGENVKQVIDICCNIAAYLEEFTEVTKDIAKYILDDKEKPADVVNKVIRNWKTFWKSPVKQILSEEELIGLICELKVLKDLLTINPGMALSSWTGPLAEKHDFSFTDWNLEIKGTRRGGSVHTINGIDQLEPPHNKSLGLISFLVSPSTSAKAINLQEIVEDISIRSLNTRPDLLVRFNELLAAAGYSPIYATEYERFSIEILSAIIYTVDDAFPSLTTAKLRDALNARITNVRYDISLEGI